MVYSPIQDIDRYFVKGLLYNTVDLNGTNLNAPANLHKYIGLQQGTLILMFRIIIGAECLIMQLKKRCQTSILERITK